MDFIPDAQAMIEYATVVAVEQLWDDRRPSWLFGIWTSDHYWRISARRG